MQQQLRNDNNPLNTSPLVLKEPINTYASIGPFYSIKLKELNTLFAASFISLPCARAACVALWHLNKYIRNIQQDFRSTYGFNFATIHLVIKKLNELGFIRPVNCKRITNIGLHVPLTAYQITPEGKRAVKILNELLQSKISKLKA